MTRLPLAPQMQTTPDPNEAQRLATDPKSSVWVSASAGTGKTTVLTARVLRLLLPKHNEPEHRTQPHKILCITYTKAAAAEMVQRVMSEAAKWATLPDVDLTKALVKLYGVPPTLLQFDAARCLFAALVEAPSGMNFMTIHSFCESLLKRFPLEAGLSPHFEVLDEQESVEILNAAIKGVIEQGASSGLGTAQDAYNVFQQNISEKKFNDLIKAAFLGRQKLALFYQDPKLREAIFKTLGFNSDKPDIIVPPTLIQSINTIADILKNGSKTDVTNAEKLSQWLLKPDQYLNGLQDVIGCFFVQKTGEPKLPTKKLKENFPQLETLYTQTGNQLSEIQDEYLNFKCAKSTAATTIILQEIIKRYQEVKQQRACLDFDDLILKTKELLSDNGENAAPIIGWIHYKLDGGIDHVLLDEAQDTNNHQWSIIRSLISDFFSGDGRYHDDHRTIFVVGDYKQSIYSFQGAEPKTFRDMEATLGQHVRQSGKKWTSIPLHTSFRSSAPVLQVVDRIFAGTAGLALGNNPKDPLHHICFREGHAGSVTCWPLIEREKVSRDQNIASNLWQPPITRIPYQNPEAKLASLIADDIQNLIGAGKYTAGDILILVRRRNAFVDHLIRALKLRSIPTSGADRMVLQTHIAIEDLIVAARFALQPQDDLSLAGLLKSPFIGLPEDALYTLTRPFASAPSLWDKAKQHLSPDITNWLEKIITLAPASGLYDFFAHILFTPAPADMSGSGYRSVLRRLGRDAVDPIEEFLNLCLSSDLDAGISVEKFIQNFMRNPITIKRELEKAGTMVRIMTVHAAKGLEAPVVYLPDCFGQQAHIHQPRIIWPDDGSIEAPIIMPSRTEDRSTLLNKILDKQYALRQEENLRLLYVALTRAQDHLIICGTVPAKVDMQDNWHELVQKALISLEKTQTIETPTGLGVVYRQESTAVPDTKTTKSETQKTDTPTPPWLFTPLTQDQHIAPIINPSRGEGFEAAVLSPLIQGDQNRYTRGLLVHKLLQILPDIKPDIRGIAARNWLLQKERMPDDLNADTLVEEILDVLNHSDFKDLFGPNARAEVPIVGQRKDGAIIAGQVDRLIIGPQIIKIIDYKTNRPAPMDLEKVPDIYLKQMQAYAEILRRMYPNHAIRAALLWTDGPKLLEIPV